MFRVGLDFRLFVLGILVYRLFRGLVCLGLDFYCSLLVG